MPSTTNCVSVRDRVHRALTAGRFNANRNSFRIGQLHLIAGFQSPEQALHLGRFYVGGSLNTSWADK